MIYRLDSFTENNINPITKNNYDDSWIICMLTNNNDYQQLCGSNNGCAYTIKVSRYYKFWKTAICDFIGFNEENNKNIILVISNTDLNSAKAFYGNHRFNEHFLRENEPRVLIHSTPMSNWESIKRDGMLKSWNKLKEQNETSENEPIGVILGDPTDFSNYIMFGGGVTGEIVVNSKEKGKIVMNENENYMSGARLYFDAKKMAENGLLIRDGCHIKVKNILPLKPYLLWTATWYNIGLTSQISTPKLFSEQADKHFKSIYNYL